MALATPRGATVTGRSDRTVLSFLRCFVRRWRANITPVLETECGAETGRRQLAFTAYESKMNGMQFTQSGFSADDEPEACCVTINK